MRSYLDGTDKCVADYILDFEQSSTSNLALTSGEVEGVVECAFKRDFLVPNLFAIRTDQSMAFQAGFNTFDGTQALQRNAYGNSELMEVLVQSPREEADVVGRPRSQGNTSSNTNETNNEPQTQTIVSPECICPAQALAIMMTMISPLFLIY